MIESEAAMAEERSWQVAMARHKARDLRATAIVIYIYLLFFGGEMGRPGVEWMRCASRCQQNRKPRLVEKKNANPPLFESQIFALLPRGRVGPVQSLVRTLRR